jgi:hypothetical protein
MHELTITFDEHQILGQVFDLAAQLRWSIEEQDPSATLGFYEAAVDDRQWSGQRLRSDVPLTEITVIVSSAATLGKVLIELLKSRRVSFTLKDGEREVKYEGSPTSEALERLTTFLSSRRDETKHDELR